MTCKPRLGDRTSVVPLVLRCWQLLLQGFRYATPPACVLTHFQCLLCGSARISLHLL